MFDEMKFVLLNIYITQNLVGQRSSILYGGKLNFLNSYESFKLTNVQMDKL